MKPDNSRILTINGGSSSIKFALYQVGQPLKRGLHGKVDRIGLSGTNLTFNDPATNQLCDGLGFLGIELNESRNADAAGMISTDASRVAVRVIRTDEDLMIARSVCRILKTDTVTKGLIHENQHAQS